MIPQIFPVGSAATYSAKDPNDTDFFQLDFTLMLASYNDSINSTPVISVNPSGNLGIFGITYSTGATGIVGFYASGGLNNTQYVLDIEITTSLSPSGRILNRSVILPVMTR